MQFFATVSHSPRLPVSSRLLVACALSALLAACGGGGDTVVEDPAQACRSQANDTPDKLTACVTSAGVQAHLAAFARIAQDNGGSRAVGTPGYAASVDYVAQQLRSAGYQVQVQEFQHRMFELQGASTLEVRAPVAESLAHDILTYSGSADVTAAVALPAGIEGCSADDFRGFPAGRIALVRRGTCSFTTKADNAAAAGAAAMVLYNNEPEAGAFGLDEDFTSDLAVASVSGTVGERLAAAVGQGLVLHLRAATRRWTGSSYNVLAESAGGDASQVMMAGAHLDSVPGTAGINDNGSGTAVLLETALQMARVAPRYKLRFGFWGSEEVGLLGSAHYVESLDAAQVARIAAYLNFDMLASPNYVFQVYAGEGDPVPGQAARAPAADGLRALFTGFYQQRGQAWQEAQDVIGRSDQDAFATHGIPYAGLFTGAEEVKTAQQAAAWGGQAGQHLDACYHKACDGLANINTVALDVNADAVAQAIVRLAMHGLPR